MGKNYVYLVILLMRAMLFNQGFHFDKLNIGNVYNNEYKICCSASVFLCDKEIKCI